MEQNPFSSITLCMSGGGYRSAAYQLGTMSMLERHGLLKKVNLISTVSGGTFAGMLYALSLKEEIPFRLFYENFRKKMADADLLLHALQFLSLDKLTELKKSNNLINAMTLVYREVYFGDKTLAVFRQPKPEIHLREMIFNSTEFSHGLAFRFRVSDNENSYTGNNYFRIPDPASQELRLADIVASSSCFPIGFEPLKFPHDYIRGNDTPELSKLKADPLYQQGVGLMDGGIADNQGIGSAMLEHERSGNYPGMIIISDVASRQMEPYRFPPSSSSRVLDMNLRSVNLMMMVLTVLMLLTAGFAITEFIGALISPSPTGVITGVSDFLIYLFAPIILFVNAGIFILLRIFLWKNVFNRVPRVRGASWKYFRLLRLSTYVDMIRLRVSSGTTLASESFMVAIRRLLFEKLYANEKYQNSRVSNLIYALAKNDQSSTKKNNTSKNTEAKQEGKSEPVQIPAEIENASQDIRRVAGIASAMPTTLWFDESDLKGKTFDNKLNCLIACGQFTICYNLLRFLHRYYGSDPEKFPAEAKMLYANLLSDWRNLQRDPFYFVEMYQK